MITGYRPSAIGRKTSARRTIPSSIAMGTSQSIRIPSRISLFVASLISPLLPSSPPARRESPGPQAEADSLVTLPADPVKHDARRSVKGGRSASEEGVVGRGEGRVAPRGAPGKGEPGAFRWSGDD